MAVSEEVLALHGEGYREELAQAIRPAEGVEAFQRILARQRPQVVVWPRDLEAAIVQSRARPEPEEEAAVETAHARPELEGTPYVAPSSELESELAELWQELLGISRVGTDDNFFELGGDSLLANQLMSRVRRRRRTEVPLRVFLASPTVARLATVIERGEGDLTELTEVEKMLQEIKAMGADEVESELQVELKDRD